MPLKYCKSTGLGGGPEAMLILIVLGEGPEFWKHGYVILERSLIWNRSKVLPITNYAPDNTFKLNTKIKHTDIIYFQLICRFYDRQSKILMTITALSFGATFIIFLAEEDDSLGCWMAASCPASPATPTRSGCWKHWKSWGQLHRGWIRRRWLEKYFQTRLQSRVLFSLGQNFSL